MVKKLETIFEKIKDKENISKLLECLNGAQKTREDISKYFVSKGIPINEEYLVKLIETGIKNQLIHYGNPVFEGKHKKYDTYRTTKAGRRLYRGEKKCHQEQAQQI